MTWTIPQDIKDRWIAGKMLPVDTMLNTFIKDVETQITNKYPAINDRIASNELSQDTIVFHVSRIVIEYLLTEGTPYQQESQSYSGIGSRSVSVSTSARKTLLLTDADLALFAPANLNTSVMAVTMNYGTGRCVGPYYLGWLDDLYA